MKAGASPRKLLWPAFVGVILIAFFFRFYRLADHPLGIFFDPAINGLDAIRLMQRGGHVLFFPTNGGRESLFIYLLIPFIRLFDTTPLAMRALTATLSLLTVALLFAFLRAMRCLDFGGSKKIDTLLKAHNLWFSTLAALSLATMYWHIAISRLGQRPILVPFLAVPLFWFFLRGWAIGQKRWFLLSGIFMGLEGYTYSAARLLPVILVLALLPEVFLRPGHLKKQAANLLIFGSTALVVYLPMGLYLLIHPAQFTARAGSVMVWNFLNTPAEIIREVGQNSLRVLGFFCCQGSPNPIFGLPGWPGLPPALAPFLLIGFIVALIRWRHLFYRLIALWWLIGIAPSILAIEAPHPLRMIVGVVPTAILVAIGLVFCFYWLGGKVPGARYQLPGKKRYPLRTTIYVLPFLLILIPLPAAFRAYFVDWTQLQSARGAYDYGAIAVRDTIASYNADTAIYLPLARFNDATLLYYLSGPYRREAKLNVPPAAKAVVISPERNEQDKTWVRLQNGLATILPPLTENGRRLIHTALSGDTTPIKTVGGETIARLAPLPAGPAQFLQQPTRRLTAAFGPAQLTGAAFEMEIDPAGDQLPVTLFWQAAEPMRHEYEVILQLVDDARRVWGDGSGRPNDWAYPTSFWRPHVDEIAGHHPLRLNTTTLPPGRYWLAVSLFDPATQQRLPLTQGSSNSPDTVFIGPLKVPLPPPAVRPPAIEPVDFGDVARLSGVSLEPQTLAPGESIEVTLLWQALTTPDLDYTVFIHLLDENDTLAAGHDSQPVSGQYPTSIWTPGETIIDTHTLPLPATLPPGEYRLALGLYHQPTGRRLPVQRAGEAPDPQGRLLLPAILLVE